MAWVGDDELMEGVDVGDEAPSQQELRAPRRDDRGGTQRPAHDDHYDVEEEEPPPKKKGNILIPAIAGVALLIGLIPIGVTVSRMLGGSSQQVASPMMAPQQQPQQQPYPQGAQAQQPNNGFGPAQPQPNPIAYAPQPQPGPVAPQPVQQPVQQVGQQPQPMPPAGAAMEGQGNPAPQNYAAGQAAQPATPAPDDAAMAKVAAQMTESLTKEIEDTKLALGGLAVTSTETKETIVAVSAKVDDLARSVDALRDAVEKLVGKRALGAKAKVVREQASPPTPQPALTAMAAAPAVSAPPPPAAPAAISTPARRSPPSRGTVWTVRAVSGGQAWLGDDQGNMKQVSAGTYLDGYGRVQRVFQDGVRWVVDTDNGRIEQH